MPQSINGAKAQDFDQSVRLGAGLSGTIFAVFLVFLLGGCGSPGTNNTQGDDSSSGQRWVATTGQVYDALKRISAGTDVSIKLFCGPGIDPHSFSASTKDVRAMEDAEAIFYNGFHLEAKLHALLNDRYAQKSWAMASAFPEEDRLDWQEDGKIDPEAPFDPHIWNHLPGWSKCVEALIDHLCQIDPSQADLFRANGQKYLTEIQQAHQDALAEFSKIPPENRVLVSAHDAFHYFAEVYGFQTVAVLGIGNDAEADVKTISQVATTICDRRVPVIFLETITNRKVTEALQEACQARDWAVRIADEPLYSDDLGSEPPQDTFLGAFRSNVRLIASSLSQAND